MKRQFDIHFERPEPVFRKEIDVPEHWDELDYDAQRAFLEAFVEESGIRPVYIEDIEEY